MYRKALFLAVAILVVTAAYAQAGPRPMAPGGILRQLASARMQARLNLTPDQMKQIRQIAADHRAKMQAAVKAPAVNAAQERQALMKAIFSDNPNPAEIEKREAAISQLQAGAIQRQQQQLNQQVSLLLEINKVFTPEQRAEFQKMLDENVRTGQIMRGRMMMRRGMGRRGPAAPQPQGPPPPSEQ